MSITSPTPGVSPPVLHPAIVAQGVLLVEDCSVHRGMAVDLLREAGVTCIYEAVDGISAMALLARLEPPPALIVLDLNLPKMDGIEILRALAKGESPPAVLLLSGSDAAVLDSINSLSREIGLRSLGAVAKPVNVQSLRDALLRFRAIDSTPGTRSDAMPEVTEEELAEALREDRILAHYQPKVDLRTGLTIGLEALARWRKPDGGMIPPVLFIPVAERSGLVDALTRRMLDCVLADLAIWQGHGFVPKIALNVSCHSLSSTEFTDELLAKVEAAGVPTDCLTLEVTESAVASDPTTALGCIGRLRMRGFGLSIDDYGTGFSSLQQLARMPFSELKVDRSFVTQANDSQRQRTILGSAIDVGRRLGLSTVAEGIETPAELATVSQLGCDVGQGYLLAKPMAPEAVLPWRAESAQRVADLCAAAKAG